MKATIEIEDELLAKAREYTGIHTVEELVYQGIKGLIELEAGRRLARLGGSSPNLKAPPRRRPPRKRLTAPGI
jgi:Arc/MetJ family transcription regulator